MLRHDIWVVRITLTCTLGPSGRGLSRACACSRFSPICPSWLGGSSCGLSPVIPLLFCCGRPRRNPFHALLDCCLTRRWFVPADQGSARHPAPSNEPFLGSNAFDHWANHARTLTQGTRRGPEPARASPNERADCPTNAIAPRFRLPWAPRLACPLGRMTIAIIVARAAI